MVTVKTDSWLTHPHSPVISDSTVWTANLQGGVGEGRTNLATKHCSPRAIGWKRSADVICFQWLFQKNNCGDTGRSIIWIFVFECSVCVVLREGRKYSAADPNTIKNGLCVCVCRGICRSGNHHWDSDIIGRITKCVLSVSIGWCSPFLFPSYVSGKTMALPWWLTEQSSLNKTKTWQSNTHSWILWNLQKTAFIHTMTSKMFFSVRWR